MDPTTCTRWSRRSRRPTRPRPPVRAGYGAHRPHRSVRRRRGRSRRSPGRRASCRWRYWLRSRRRPWSGGRPGRGTARWAARRCPGRTRPSVRSRRPARPPAPRAERWRRGRAGTPRPRRPAPSRRRASARRGRSARSRSVQTRHPSGRAPTRSAIAARASATIARARRPAANAVLLFATAPPVTSAIAAARPCGDQGAGRAVEVGVSLTQGGVPRAHAVDVERHVMPHRPERPRRRAHRRGGAPVRGSSGRPAVGARLVNRHQLTHRISPFDCTAAPLS